jgi:hypothetical protein
MSGRRDTPAATAVPRIPDTVEELLTPAWVTSALAGRFPGVRVTSVTPGPVVSRVSTNVRFHIEGELPDGLCPDLCVKGYFSEVGASYRHVGEPEAYFYRDIAGSTGMRTLRSVYADVDPATRHGVVITEDIVAQGGTFLDARSDYTPDQTAESLGELAKLHAATWSQSHYADAPLLASRLESYFAVRGVADIRGNFEGPIGARVPDAVRDAERLADVFARLAVSTPSVRPWAVIHGDAHVGNVYLDGGGRPAFLDWQLVQRGPWYLDVGYHLVSALTIEDRRRTERDLVQHYLDRLRAGGVDAPSSDDAWSGIRRGIVYGFFLWGITLKVDPAVTSTLLERLGTATADHDAFAAVA